jgi:ribosomal protein S18 acetylase RimI-like enzyme
MVEEFILNERKEKGVEQRVIGRRVWLDTVEIGAVDASEIEEALDVAARGMRDNPLTVAAFGNDPEQRRQRLRRFMSGAARALGWGPNMLVARGVDGEIAGVANMMPPGECLSSPSQQLWMLPSLLSNGPRAAGRMMCWLGLWSRRDPAERHWHLGPLAVDAHLQGMGVGSLLMQVFCAQMDAAREDAYLETDRPENVRFYERFGFGVVGEGEVLGVTNWFMLRRAEGRPG